MAISFLNTPAIKGAEPEGETGGTSSDRTELKSENYGLEVLNKWKEVESLKPAYDALLVLAGNERRFFSQLKEGRDVKKDIYEGRQAAIVQLGHSLDELRRGEFDVVKELQSWIRTIGGTPIDRQITSSDVLPYDTSLVKLMEPDVLGPKIEDLINRIEIEVSLSKEEAAKGAPAVSVKVDGKSVYEDDRKGARWLVFRDGRFLYDLYCDENGSIFDSSRRGEWLEEVKDDAGKFKAKLDAAIGDLTGTHVGQGDQLVFIMNDRDFAPFTGSRKGSSATFWLGCEEKMNEEGVDQSQPFLAIGAAAAVRGSNFDDRTFAFAASSKDDDFLRFANGGEGAVVQIPSSGQPPPTPALRAPSVGP